ncbi:MAG: hypothetical protein SVZ03_05360 [Spirochaetota bacterium]|nr:hypothetical protein [Spirochaetota bacterium]
MKIINLLPYTIIIALITIQVNAQEEGIKRFTFGNNQWISLHFLLQAQGKFTEVYQEGLETPSDSSLEKSFFLRRSRIILNGEITKNVAFFMETNDINAGKNSDDIYENSDDGSNNLFTQSAFINYRISDGLQIDLGLMLLPFMHHNRQSEVSPLGIDLISAVVPLNGYSSVWRDTGLEIRGLLFENPIGKKGFIDYRIGVWQGKSKELIEVTDDTGIVVDEYNKNPDDHLRYTGRVQFNLMDPETGFFYSGNYLGKRKIFSFGFGLDSQQDVCRHDNRLKNYLAWTVDLTIDYGARDSSIFTLQAAYVKVKNNPVMSDYRLFSSSESEIYDRGFINQEIYLIQTGLIIAKGIQPVIKYYRKVEERAIIQNNKIQDRESSHIIGGINYFLNGHNTNIKSEFAYPMGDHNKGSGNKYGLIQLQIFI